MALRFMDSFDAGDHLIKGWTPGLGTINSVLSSRFGVGHAVQLTASSRTLTKSLPFSGRVFMGAAVNVQSLTTAGTPFYFLADGGAQAHLYLRINAGGSIDVVRASNTVLASAAAGTISTTGWCFLEFAATLADSGGTAVVRLNGVEIINFTGDTRNGGTSTQIDTIRIVGNHEFDDLYACDDSGAAPNNTFLGDVRIHTLVPTGAGNSTQMTPSTGSNWAAVDELPYSETDYVSSGTAGHKDTYATGNLPAGVSTIYGTQLNVIGKKTDAGARSIIPVVRSGGTDYAGATSALTAAAATLSDLRTVDPATSAAWTVSGVNAVEIGAEVV